MDLIPSTDSLLAFTGLILGFGFVIFVHELGHFLVAKAVGIKVTQFAIGFGPSVLAWRKGLGLRAGSTEAEYEQLLKQQSSDGKATDVPGVSETEYRVNWLPLGGYVKMLGQEDMDPTAASDDPRSFSAKPAWARACVICAGVTMNLIFGLIFLIVAFRFGVELPPPIIGGVVPDMPAAKVYALGHKDDPKYLGIKAGDRIAQVDGAQIDDFTELAIKTALAGKGQTLRLTVKREGEPKPLYFDVVPTEDSDTHLLALGLATPIATTLSSVPDDLKAAGVKADMSIVKVADQPVQRYGQFNEAVSAKRGQPVPVTFADAKTGKTVVVDMVATPLMVPFNDEAAGKNNKKSVNDLLGLAPATVVREVIARTPAAKSGLKSGDLLAKIGASAWPTVSQTIDLIIAADSRPINVAVLRDGEWVDLGAVTPKSGKLGIALAPAADLPIVAQTRAGSPAANLDLPGGSKVTSIDGQPVADFVAVQQRLAAFAEQHPDGGPVEIGYTLNVVSNPTGARKIDVDADAVKALAAAPWAAPLSPSRFIPMRERVSGDNFADAAALGVEKTHQFMLQTYLTLLRLTQGTVKIEHMRGPLGIVDEGTRVARHGWEYLMFFLGVISINLVVINMLPIPIVDGGLLLFLIIEKVKGSPVGPRVQTAATLVGLALIVSVFALVTFFDVTRLIK